MRKKPKEGQWLFQGHTFSPKARFLWLLVLVPSNLPWYIIIDLSKDIISSLKDFLNLFSERGEGRERNIYVWLPLARPLLGTWPTILAGALTGNATGNPLVCRRALNPLSHTSQGRYYIIFNHTNMNSNFPRFCIKNYMGIPDVTLH